MAIDAATGQERWVYDPEVDLHEGFSEISSRGVAVWPAGGVAARESAGGVAPAQGSQRLFIGTIDGRLIALDAATGRPVPSFGKGGTVDLKVGLGEDIAETSP